MLELVSFDLCPYVQRSVITLLEKRVEFRLTYIDLAAKPDWFLALSPTGKVPVLRTEQGCLFESAVINEFLDETTGPDRLLPVEPMERARARMWIEFCSGLGGPGYRLMVESDEARSREAAAEAKRLFARLEAAHGGESTGSPGQLAEAAAYWLGRDFSLVDAAAAPFLQRLSWIDAIAPDLHLFTDAPRVRCWTDALLARPSVRDSVRPGLEDTFHAYLRGGGSPARKAAPAWLASRLPPDERPGAPAESRASEP